ncbi:hypothetical protein [Citrobacter amalonaticus]|uniref:hypothetical protein n=1 Tax=Citrobacter amalonaticus TaxID=35703 RepID=UPI0028C1C77C|nr:hypothetical protein [Citrobacter amalonaticus]MDT7072809.1 hypothetical protein [Citrobacter amalonaticus]HED3078465.1 hypothetical protein [Citrobacter amalonaticus]HED3672162.1 hypothetical protein [Citrobacter amalonaticus]HED3697703.1 hypothetical protein [Citrobacter amalonaticus]
MNVSVFAGLIFWGMMALVLSELMTLSVNNTQAGLVWLSYGLWATAAVMVIRVGIQTLQARRAKRSGVNSHEM